MPYRCGISIVVSQTSFRGETGGGFLRLVAYCILIAICGFLFQAIPVALSGRDIIGIAKTGSGKTAAFLWPALVHIMDQPELEPGDGPIALICAPTRELCQQIFIEARRFGKVYNIHAVAVFGGGNKYEQSKALQEGAEIVVATPVRKLSSCNCLLSGGWGGGGVCVCGGGGESVSSMKEIGKKEWKVWNPNIFFNHPVI